MIVTVKYSRYPENRQHHKDQEVFDPARNKYVNACRECGIPSQGRFHYYCSKEHKEKWERENVPNGWGQMRELILKRDGHKCVECGKTDADLKGDLQADLVDYMWKLQYLYCLEVDHIQPVKTHPELEYEPSNLRTLCHACHRMHGARPQDEYREILRVVPNPIESFDQQETQ